MTDYSDFLEEFFEEFQFRIEALTRSQPDEKVRKEILLVLVENLILKYENRMQKSRQSFIKRIIPFLSSQGYDEAFEEEMNQQLEHMTKPGYNMTNGNSRSRYQVNGKLTESFHQLQYQAKQQNIVPYFENKILRQVRSEVETMDLDQYSKTNLPPGYDLALELNLLKGKGQDHLDYFVNDSGMIGIILSDGVSGDGPESTYMAQSVPKNLGKYLKDKVHRDLTLKQWQALIVDGLEEVVRNYSRTKGASTVLVVIVSQEDNQAFVSWLGDGHILYFNETLTGYSKLLTSHQNQKGQLTKVVTSEGIIGSPSVQIISATGGAFILSSDGYNLTNGRLLRHFYQVVLRESNLQQGLGKWVRGTCGDEQFHPVPNDDRSIGVIRWGIDQ